MGWLSIILALIPLLKILLDWLMTRKSLTERQRVKINHILWQFKQIESKAVPLGCKKGGEPEEE